MRSAALVHAAPTAGVTGTAVTDDMCPSYTEVEPELGNGGNNSRNSKISILCVSILPLLIPYYC
jgi:hypothetical protein